MARPKAFTDEALKAAARQVFLKQGRRASVATIAGLLGVTVVNAVIVFPQGEHRSVEGATQAGA